MAVWSGDRRLAPAQVNLRELAENTILEISPGELAATFDQLAHHRVELLLHGATQATVGQFVELPGRFLTGSSGRLPFV